MVKSQAPVPEGLILAFSVLVSFSMVVGGLWWWGGRETSADSQSTAAAPTTTPPNSSSPPRPESATVCPVNVEQIICDLVAFVERERGQPFKTFPTVELAENTEFDERLLEGFDEETEDLSNTGDTLRSLGLIETDADLVKIFRASLEVGVVGFYDPETAELVVRGGTLDLYAQSVLVHELVHAHDDQWFDLDRPELDDASDESGFGFSAVVEGNASRVEDAWVDQLNDADRAELFLLEAQALSPEDLAIFRTLPMFVLQLQISPYTDGLELVEEIARSGGEDAVNAALTNPPTTSEQVLHPERRDEAAVSVALPSAPGTEVDSGSFGELALRHWLGRDAAEGWGGDQYITYTDGDDVCTRVVFAMDSNDELDELEVAAARWADRSARRTVDLRDDAVTITGCVNQ